MFSVALSMIRATAALLIEDDTIYNIIRTAFLVIKNYICLVIRNAPVSEMFSVCTYHRISHLVICGAFSIVEHNESFISCAGRKPKLASIAAECNAVLIDVIVLLCMPVAGDDRKFIFVIQHIHCRLAVRGIKD